MKAAIPLCLCLIAGAIIAQVSTPTPTATPIPTPLPRPPGLRVTSSNVEKTYGSVKLADPAPTPAPYTAKLMWDYPDPAAAKVVEYRIYERLPNQQKPTLMGKVAVPALEWLSGSLTGNHTYIVTAATADNLESLPSNDVLVTQPTLPPAPSNARVTVTVQVTINSP